MNYRVTVSTTMLFALAVLSSPARAETPARPWSNVADFGLVMTGGNTQTNSFSFGDKYVYKWTDSDFTLQAVAIRSHSDDRTLSNPNGTAVETRVSKLQAEIYSLDGKYRQTISDRLFWYGIVGWLRNVPSGINARTMGGAGVGYKIVRTDKDNLSAELGADYTREKDLDETRSFAGARAFMGYDHKLSENSKFLTELELLEDLKDTQNLRGRWMAAVTGKLTAALALKASFTVLYDRQPPTQDVPPDAGVTPVPPVAKFTYKQTDTILTTSLVWTF